MVTPKERPICMMGWHVFCLWILLALTVINCVLGADDYSTEDVDDGDGFDSALKALKNEVRSVKADATVEILNTTRTKARNSITPPQTSITKSESENQGDDNDDVEHENETENVDDDQYAEIEIAPVSNKNSTIVPISRVKDSTDDEEAYVGVDTGNAIDELEVKESSTENDQGEEANDDAEDEPHRAVTKQIVEENEEEEDYLPQKDWFNSTESLFRGVLGLSREREIEQRQLELRVQRLVLDDLVERVERKSGCFGRLFNSTIVVEAQPQRGWLGRTLESMSCHSPQEEGFLSLKIPSECKRIKSIVALKGPLNNIDGDNDDSSSGQASRAENSQNLSVTSVKMLNMSTVWDIWDLQRDAIEINVALKKFGKIISKSCPDVLLRTLSPDSTLPLGTFIGIVVSSPNGLHSFVHPTSLSHEGIKLSKSVLAAFWRSVFLPLADYGATKFVLVEMVLDEARTVIRSIRPITTSELLKSDESLANAATDLIKDLGRNGFDPLQCPRGECRDKWLLVQAVAMSDCTMWFPDPCARRSTSVLVTTSKDSNRAIDDSTDVENASESDQLEERSIFRPARGSECTPVVDEDMHDIVAPTFDIFS